MASESSSGLTSGDSAPISLHTIKWPVMDFIGFKIEKASPEGVEGRFVVSDRSCQGRGVLHGGISAFITESLASLGGQLAAMPQLVAGVELSISHLQAAPVGLEIEVKATPIRVGRKLQVWEVKFTSTGDVSNGPKQEPALIAVSKLTLAVTSPTDTSKLNDVTRSHSKL